ncbi:response regulator [Paenibacillus sp. 19GGS1-52]|uniref:HD domain-containing phosphohydrolase n=1 Tax=Paenibacillus sp. 19GGS1-52 TaxID=2758563 RepID=UPI001EFB4B1F|nr:HD domain-containing phosphohydrolase [Paenibacillus sp. 19GGS1-52]ULO07699.1 response regulator [Paenibacillus sp. 19GGS1-52]
MDTTILIVDDSKSDVALIKIMLHDYQLLYAANGYEAMQMIDHDPSIELIVLDLNMPVMNGFEVLNALKQPQYSKIVPIILTNHDEIENEVKGLALGAMDFIRKPLNMEALRKRIEIQLALRNSRVMMEDYNLRLQNEVEIRTKELVLSRDISINVLVGLLEVRNLESSNHTIRTQYMVRKLCEHLKLKADYYDIFTDEYIQELFRTTPLHDIGKVGIPDHILLKPGKLTPEEFEIMKKHVDYGVDALMYNLKGNNAPSFIRTALEIIGTHHERYDGTGYPHGLKGEEIPLCGRLVAIVDVYDALVHPRVYKAAFSHEKALEIINQERGRHFDPNIVDAFMEIHNEMLKITQEFEQTPEIEVE